ncbi:MAG TPA: cytidylate kinase-like family protein [Thermodesulfobacteriota bacterium]|nr:cytidylate kinase-like family protein [Thermodesulfobacteriota bacterium]
MSVITISRGSYNRGKEVAEKLAQKLGYECISRDILLEASSEYNIPEIKLIRAIHDAPSILQRLTHQKEKYIAFIRAALLKHIQKDNVVYHGLFGHFFLQDIPHVLKVRIVGALEDRVEDEVRREGISAEKAREIITRDDEERRKWALHLYGADSWDATLYDLVIHLKAFSIDDAVELISRARELPGFQTTLESQAAIDSLVEASRLETASVWWQGESEKK